MTSRPSATAAMLSHPESLPQFLRLGRTDITNKFVDLEWQQRERLAQSIQNPSQTSRWARLTGDHITNRNRYVNVEPFANNRIKLPVAEGGNDYINASPIILGNRRYIATQGPKDASTPHFYRMLAAETESPAVVVMLTQTHEAGREKCFPYFPASQQTPIQIPLDPEFNDGFQGSVELVSIEEDSTCRCTVRTLRMRTKLPCETKEEEEEVWEEKEIKHLLFSGWPDFAIPEGENRQAMLDLIDLSARLNTSQHPPPTSCFSQDSDDVFVETSSQTQPSLNPRIVHCSAGVGRSGTFIALDYLLAQLREGHLDSIPATSDPIADTVDRMRQQRMMMVQGESQFIFLYDVMRQAWIQRNDAAQQAHAGSSAASAAA